MKNKCIIHYKGLSKYSVPKTLSEVNKKRILEAKAERERLGGDHYNNHVEQCNGIPEEFNENHLIHSEPCYKKFTLILSGQSSRQKDTPEEPLRKSKRKSSIDVEEPPPVAWKYGPECQLCHSERAQYQNEDVYPYKITTFQCNDTVKAAAKAQNEVLFDEIRCLDLVAKEFKMHDHCRKKFLEGFGQEARNGNNQIVINQV